MVTALFLRNLVLQCHDTMKTNHWILCYSENFTGCCRQEWASVYKPEENPKHRIFSTIQKSQESLGKEGWVSWPPSLEFFKKRFGVSTESPSSLCLYQLLSLIRKCYGQDKRAQLSDSGLHLLHSCAVYTGQLIHGVKTIQSKLTCPYSRHHFSGQGK